MSEIDKTSLGRRFSRPETKQSLLQVLINNSDKIRFPESLVNYLLSETEQSSQSSKRSLSALQSEEDVSVTYNFTKDMQIYRSKYFANLLSAAGRWNPHRFENVPWGSNKKDSFSLKTRKIDALNENEKQGILSERMVSVGLSYLELCPEILKYVFTKCILRHKNLCDIFALQTFSFIQCLDLSGNRLTTLADLGSLPFLRFLNASNNNLTNLLDFKPPFFLGYVDYSMNALEIIPDLTQFWALICLILSHNNITKIEGLHNLKHLNYLDLSHNNIEKVENINNLPLQYLFLNDNYIWKFEEGHDVGLKTLRYLCSIDLSFNRLETLRLFDQVKSVENAYLANNNIHKLLDIYYFRGQCNLKRLDLSGNPVCQNPNYGRVCISVIESLWQLDLEELTPETKVNYRIKLTEHLSNRQHTTELLILEQLNIPKIATYMVPYDQPFPNVIVFVSNSRCKKKKLMRKCLNLHQNFIAGVSFTTRPQRENEIEGEDYYFVKNKRFLEMLRNGEFIAVSEWNGYSFGIAHKEFEKNIDKTLVFHSDLKTGLALRMSGINPKLILALPREESIFVLWLKSGYNSMKIKSNVFRVEHVKIKRPDQDDVKSKEDDLLYPDSGDSADEEDRGKEGKEDKNVTDKEDKKEKNKEDKTEEVSDKDDDKDNQKKKQSSIGSWIKRDIITGILKGRRVGASINSKGKAVSFTTGKVKFHFEDKRQRDSITSTGSYNFENVLQDKNTDDIDEDLLKKFVETALKNRNELLEFHWENTGFFREVIFTDDPDDVIDCRLKDMLKCIQKSHAKYAPKSNINNNESLEDMIKYKMSTFNLIDNRFYMKQ